DKLEHKAPSASNGKIIRQYMWKRFLRMASEYYLVQVVVLLLIPHGDSVAEHMRVNHDTHMMFCHRTWMFNLLITSDVIGFGGCGVVFWCVAVQTKQALFLPLGMLLLRPGRPNLRRRVAMTMAGMIVLTLMAKLVAPEDLSLPVPPVGSLQTQVTESVTDRIVQLYHSPSGYFSYPGRGVNFCTGVLLGLGVTAPRMRAAFSGRKARTFLRTACASSIVLWLACISLVPWHFSQSWPAYFARETDAEAQHVPFFVATSPPGRPLEATPFGFENSLRWNPAPARFFFAFVLHGGLLVSLAAGGTLLLLVLRAEERREAAARSMATLGAKGATRGRDLEPASGFRQLATSFGSLYKAFTSMSYGIYLWHVIVMYYAEAAVAALGWPNAIERLCSSHPLTGLVVIFLVALCGTSALVHCLYRCADMLRGAWRREGKAVKEE
ncbi:hypothetical protein H632_c1846p0, partial [Helicosporidium sp. ATCC 50920]